MLNVLSGRKLRNNAVIGVLIDLIEEQHHRCDDPQHTGDGRKSVVDDTLNSLALDLICLEAQHTKDCRQRGCTNSHAHLVPKGDKRILEAVVADAGFPLAVLHTVGNDGINGRVEAAEEQLGQRGASVEGNGSSHRAEEVQS